MVRYLIRSGKLPYDQIETAEYLQRNVLGSNSGNFLYLHGIIRTLMLENDVSFVSTNYKTIFTKEEADVINRNYDGYIIPLADAFRMSFLTEMKYQTRFIKKLKIPCYLIGVGVSREAFKIARSETELEQRKQQYKIDHLGEKPEGKPVFKKAVKKFINAVLDTGTLIGIRGNDTAQFLSELGYKEGEHFRVIGCPSMYTFGKHLKIRDTKKDADCPTAFNMSQSKIARGFINNAYKQFNDAVYVGQVMSELQTLYWGSDFRSYIGGGPWNADDMSFPSTIEHPLYKQDKVRFFVNVNEWLDFMKTRDLVFGTRLHGNIAGIIAGTPSIMIAKDDRMKELAEFHGLSYVTSEQLKKYKDIHELIADTDFHKPEKKQEENFLNFIDFLHANDLKTIYDDDLDRADAPLDKAIEAAGVSNPISSAAFCTPREIAERMLPSIEYFRKGRKTASRIRHARDSEIRHLYGILDCKPIKMAINVRNAMLPDDKKINITNLFEKEAETADGQSLVDLDKIYEDSEE